MGLGREGRRVSSPALSGSVVGNLVGGGSNTGFRGKLLDQIMHGWRTDPVFAPHYHEVGRVSPSIYLTPPFNPQLTLPSPPSRSPVPIPPPRRSLSSARHTIVVSVKAGEPRTNGWTDLKLSGGSSLSSQGRISPCVPRPPPPPPSSFLPLIG